MQPVARIIARLVDLNLANFEHVDLDLAVLGRQQHR
jgi:hypothetical protein